VTVFIAFPERLGEYGAAEYIGKYAGTVVDMESKNMCQEKGGYRILRIDTRDVPLAVELGALFGITGMDWYEDYRLGGEGKDLAILKDLGFGNAEICVSKRAGNITEPCRVVSPYRNIASEYLKGLGLDFCDLYGNRGKIQCIRGKTEGLVRAGLADLAVENRNSGRTLKSTGLEVWRKIMDSHAIVISRKENKYKVKEILGI
jgi:ATP phosphoribosyltransferase